MSETTTATDLAGLLREAGFLAVADPCCAPCGHAEARRDAPAGRLYALLERHVADPDGGTWRCLSCFRVGGHHHEAADAAERALREAGWRVDRDPATDQLWVLTPGAAG